MAVQLPAHRGCFLLHLSSAASWPLHWLGRQPTGNWKQRPSVMLPAEVPDCVNCRVLLELPLTPAVHVALFFAASPLQLASTCTLQRRRFEHHGESMSHACCGRGTRYTLCCCKRYIANYRGLAFSAHEQRAALSAA